MTEESQSSVAADNEDDDEGGRVSGFDDSAAEAFLASTRDSFMVAVMKSSSKVQAFSVSNVQSSPRIGRMAHKNCGPMYCAQK
jgi:hypothetical protein